VYATVGYLEFDTNKCRSVVASERKENLVIVYAVPGPRLDVDVVY